VRRAAGLVAVLALAGCGSSVETVTRVERSAERCNGIAADLTIHYAICGGHRFIRNGKTLPIGDPPGAKIGHWAKAVLSPDGRTFLAQWSAECEIPIAFFVLVRGGVPRAVTGEPDWADAPESVADGWTSDGRAIDDLRHGACGTSAKRPGIYFVSPDAQRTFVLPLPRSR
jgi:hypothetical protein